MKLTGEFEELLRSRQTKYLSDTYNMLCTLADRLLEGLEFEKYREKMEEVIASDKTTERDELLYELKDIYPREAERLTHRLDVLRYLCQEIQERLEQTDMKSISLVMHELPITQARPSLPDPGNINWQSDNNTIPQKLAE